MSNEKVTELRSTATILQFRRGSEARADEPIQARPDEPIVIRTVGRTPCLCCEACDGVEVIVEYPPASGLLTAEGFRVEPKVTMSCPHCDIEGPLIDFWRAREHRS